MKSERQKLVKVYYESEEVGEFKTDIIVNDLVIVEIKSTRTIAKEFEVQIVNYLTATKKSVGLLVNFSENKVEIKRKVRKFSANRAGKNKSCKSC